MKLNKQGFTMVELLAALAILAIFSGIAVIAVTRYQEKARKDSYEAMEASAFSAAQNYIQDKGIVVSTSSPKTFKVSDLVDEGYLPKLQDPRSKDSYCHNGSTVTVKKTDTASGSTLSAYEYLVVIKCKNYTSSRTEAGEEKEGIYFYS